MPVESISVKCLFAGSNGENIVSKYVYLECCKLIICNYLWNDWCFGQKKIEFLTLEVWEANLFKRNIVLFMEG